MYALQHLSLLLFVCLWFYIGSGVVCCIQVRSCLFTW